ncbi:MULTISPECIES: glutamine-hydrolyzing carbamoyl-phosphate synthase small subunit [Methylotenera]|uniref:glutamine-hydrolyzing carbamoyl-phosphate synthase small subunit n=1 Tax=Methylotenera TaxID=359407 RepID=UPI00037131BD|nr:MULTISPECIES: glutamine-hydrolyzing carbamoyl-phosphate synthase small subunit [Methylotenera]
MSKTIPAVLVLADGTVFKGISIGTSGHTVGEVVFNTAMTGYQEILTDPSYSKQIVTLTYPHIGNTGTNAEDVESDQVYAAGLIIRDLPLLESNFRSAQTLSEYLVANNVLAIADIDTRKLTRILREKGAQAGCILAGENATQDIEVKKALSLAQSFPGLAGMDLAKVVSCKKAYEFSDGEWALGKGFENPEKTKFHVVAFDYGVKQNILRMLVSRGCKVTVLPAQATAEEALSYQPDGIFLSNGPGDPEPCDYAIKAIKTLVDTGIPTFGICLGHQLLALASGAKTIKMKFGHHGANHPVQDVVTKRVYITSQNHGFAADPATLPSNIKITHISLFDGSLQGIARTDKPAFSFQGHPEASPGPTEMSELFDQFISLMQKKEAA